MTCLLEHKRAVGDTLSKWAVQFTRSGVAPNITDKIVKFVMYDSTGAVKIAETATGITVVDPVKAWVDYDFQAAGVDTAGIYKAFFHVYDALGAEKDTYPEEEEGIIVTIFDQDEAIEEVIPVIDIVAAANTPLRVRTVEGTVQERSIDELIKADRYNQLQNADAVPWGMRIARTKPPSTLS